MASCNNCKNSNTCLASAYNPAFCSLWESPEAITSKPSIFELQLQAALDHEIRSVQRYSYNWVSVDVTKNAFGDWKATLFLRERKGRIITFVRSFGKPEGSIMDVIEALNHGNWKADLVLIHPTLEDSWGNPKAYYFDVKK